MSKKSNSVLDLDKPLPIKLSNIGRYARQPRQHIDRKGIPLLADDIQRNGQKTPIVICLNINKKGKEKFILICGERRWSAFSVISEREKSDPIIYAFIRVIGDEKELFEAAFDDNLLRENLLDIDMAASLHRLHKEGKTISELAVKIGKSITYVESYIKMHSLPDGVKNLMLPEIQKNKRLSTSTAIDIARSTTSQSLRQELADEAVERNLSVAETRGLIDIKTGQAGYRVGGRLRKPSDDYKNFKSFLGRTIKRAKALAEKIDFGEIYQHRDEEEEDRGGDAYIIGEIISHLQRLKNKIEEEK